ncbi:MAG TPA: hypothetical protein VGD38_09515, partial [Pyrinomonadaceae bacterium]
MRKVADLNQLDQVKFPVGSFSLTADGSLCKSFGLCGNAEDVRNFQPIEVSGLHHVLMPFEFAKRRRRSLISA